MTIARRLLISGLVQGVGFRDALQREALARGIGGWVRNRRDGSVEALLQGDASAVEAIAAWARIGPPAARVADVRIEDVPADPAAAAGFNWRPTA